MNYKGVIIQESLGDTVVLELVHIKKTIIEQVTPEHKTPWIPTWTLHTVEILEHDADRVASILANSFDPAHPYWYADFKNDQYHYIVYAERVFKIDRSNPIEYQDAREHGLSIGIPSYQVDFAPEDVYWER